jgi:hypothetical protein
LQRCGLHGISGHQGLSRSELLLLKFAAHRALPRPHENTSCGINITFHTEHGRAGLAAHRGEFCKLLWRLWSPNWHFDDATYEHTAASFDNSDFVGIVIHSYPQPLYRAGANKETTEVYAAREARTD